MYKIYRITGKNSRKSLKRGGFVTLDEAIKMADNQIESLHWFLRLRTYKTWVEKINLVGAEGDVVYRAICCCKFNSEKEIPTIKEEIIIIKTN